MQCTAISCRAPGHPRRTARTAANFQVMGWPTGLEPTDRLLWRYMGYMIPDMVWVNESLEYEHIQYIQYIYIYTYVCMYAHCIHICFKWNIAFPSFFVPGKRNCFQLFAWKYHIECNTCKRSLIEFWESRVRSRLVTFRLNFWCQQITLWLVTLVDANGKTKWTLFS